MTIAIIGGGIAGASTAYHLARAGRDVTLFERGEIASEASGVNAGSIGALGWGRGVADLQATLTTGSLEIFRALQLDLGYDIEFRQSGALQAIHTEAQYEFARDQVLALRANGYTVELLTIREARALEPALSPDLLGAVHSPLRAQADPRKATRAFAHAAERAGARILTGHEVSGIDPTADGYCLVSAQGEHVVESLVIAAGAWCGPVGRMLGLHIPIVPVRGQMWATEPLPPSVFRVISSTESTLAWHRRPRSAADAPPWLTHRGGSRLTRHLYGRQTRTGEIIFGGDREVLGYITSVSDAGIESNKRHAEEVLPFLADVPVRRTWSGLMPFPLDGQPIIGVIPGLPRVYAVTGLASSGFGRGPMAGRLIAEYIHSGHRPPVLAEADPARCVTLQRTLAARRRTRAATRALPRKPTRPIARAARPSRLRSR
jgi:glycine/D-amino acid oxidase-like deaminating enzyme